MRVFGMSWMIGILGVGRILLAHLRLLLFGVSHFDGAKLGILFD